MREEKQQTCSIHVEDGSDIRYGLRAEFRDLDKLYHDDMKKMIAFDIDVGVQYKDYSTPYITMLQRSIFSSMFGISSSDPKEVMDKRFRCACGNLEGPIRYELCSKCKTLTDARSAIRGWMDLKNFRVFTPHYYLLLLRSIDRTKVDSFRSGVVTATNKNEDLEEDDGVEVVYEKSKRKSMLNVYPCEWVVNSKKFTIFSMSNNESELREFINLVVTKKSEKFVLLENIKAGTTRRVPVVSKGYRPHKLTQKLDKVIDVENHPLNKEYVSISSHINKLHLIGSDGSEFSINRKLHNILCSWIKIHEIIGMILGGGKKSDIRSRINARRLPNSARLVVELFIHPDIDSVVLPYDAFGVIYCDEMFELYGRRMSAMCQHRIKSGVPNVQDKLLMTEYLKYLKYNQMNNIIVKRSPVIYESSVMSLNIIGLSNDRVLRISGQVMKAFAGDYDGDILALFVIGDKSIRKQVHDALNVSTFAIDRFTNEFNSDMGLNDSSHIIAFKMLDDGFKCGT